jgi:WD40 repeat protein
MIILSLRGKIFTVAKDRLVKVIGTYFYGMLSSGVWQPNSDGVYVIDRPSEGFDRILDCLSTGQLDCKGLTDYEIDCVYENLDYFLIPSTRLWDYSKVSQIENARLSADIQLQDGRLCGIGIESNSVCIYNMDTSIVEKTVKGPAFIGVIQLEDGRICYSSSDSRIIVRSVESAECKLTINVYTCVFCVIQLLDGRLCSGSYDNTIKIWSKDSGICELTVNAGNCVRSIVQLRDGRICTGDNYGNIKIWSIITTGVCDMTLSGHTSTIWAMVVIDGLRVCSCSNDSTIKIWNANSGVCERTLEGHTDSVMDMVLLFDGRLCSVSYDRGVKIWNVETGVCDLSITIAYMSLLRVIQLHDGRLVVTDKERVMYIVGG